MPKPKQQWLPAEQVDPNIFQKPSKKSKAIAIKKPEDDAVNRQNDSATEEGRVSHQEARASDDLNRTRSGLREVTAQEPQESVAPRLPLPNVRVAKAVISTKSTSATTRQPPLQQPPSSANNLLATSSATPSFNGALPHSEQTPNTNKRTVLQSSLDIHARNYVQYWLRAVNESAAIPVFAPFLPRIDFSDYMHKFIDVNDIQRCLPLPDLPPQQACTIGIQELQSVTYEQYWRHRLQNEYAAQAMQNETFGLFNVGIYLHDHLTNSYSIRVPGVRESTPRIDIGDVLYVRPLSPVNPDTIAQLSEEWSSTRNMVAPGFIGHEHHAVVWAVLRRDETVIVRLGTSLINGTKCNVIIPLSAHKFLPTWRAVSLAQANLDAAVSGVPWLTSMLFPEMDHGALQTSLSKGSFGLEWFDSTLNFEQKRAVQAVTDAGYGSIPYLISGPPGTGKTKTIVEAALQLLKAPSRVAPHLLVCAPSDAAADTLLVRLSAHLPPSDLFRLNSWTRLNSEVPGEVRPYCYLDMHNLYSLPPFEKLMAAKVVVTSCRDADMLAAAGLTNQVLTQTALRMLRAIAPAAVSGGDLLHWTALLLDEAAQATEPEALIPLGVVAPFEVDYKLKLAPQVIMAGDEYQLGPRLASAAVSDADGSFNTSGLETSLFQRLFSRPLYSDHPLSRSRGLPPLTKAMLPIIRPPFANLIRNYRSHPAILSTSSSLFYSDTLIPERPRASSATLSWPQWPKHSSSVWPVMFYQHAGRDSVESVLEGNGTGSGSLINHSEAQIALDTVVDLLRHVNQGSLAILNPQIGKDYLQPDEIIVMSPFRAQVNYLRQIFRVKGLYDVRIGPLEAFQGLESRVVVLCTTRTRLGQAPHPLVKYVDEDKARNLGVIDEPKRFNVAMTRAKEALIVIGNAEVLSCTRDKCWMSFLRFCLRNGLCCGGKMGWIARKDDAGRTQEAMGKLEWALRYADAQQTAEREEGDTSIDARSSGSVVQAGQQNFKLKLQGTMGDLDDEMWQMQIGEWEEAVMREEDELGEERDESYDNYRENQEEQEEDDGM